MELRERILNEARNQFFQFGIRNVTMDEIAVSLGISKRTVYETFRDKTELIETCIKNISEEQDLKNTEILDHSENMIETIFTFMQLGIKAINSINPVFYIDLKKFYPKIWEDIHKKNTEKNQTLSYKMLEKGVKEGIFRKEIDIPIVAKLFHAQIDLITDENIFPRNEYNTADIFKNMIINFTRGISTNKGIEIIDKMTE